MLVPEGRYRAVAVPGSACLTETAKGTEYVAVDFRLKDDGVAGEVLPWSGWMSDKAMPYTERALKAMGWDGVSLSELGPLDKEVSVQVEHDDRGGNRITAKVSFVNAPPKRLAADKMAALEKRRKERIIALRSAAEDPFADPE